MKAVLFYLFYTINWIITLLPLGILYLMSPVFFFFLYVFPGYRRKIVMKNLRNAFPEKDEVELNKISRKFYWHLSNLFIEILKLQHMRPSAFRKRYRVTNPEVLNDLLKKGQSAVGAFGHFGNWEWMASLPLVTNFKALCVYKPLYNKYFDKFFLDFRTQYGLELVKMVSTGRTIYRYESEGINTYTGLVCDQIPPNGEIQYWTRFLNQDTAVYLGIEKLSKKYNMAVVFVNMTRIKRGYYELTFELLTDKPNELKPYEVTELHVRRLEDQIMKNPQYWMWTHRRWKHKKPADA
jgi:KDO2-lipid IV(A) lauroyltransferase